jgi:tetrahydromethanopterin S-methyltransferase subunit C
MIGILSIVFNQPGYSIPDFKTFTVSAASLDQYVGTYSSKQLPLKITITKSSTVLIAQATGQSAFPLEAIAAGQFKFEQAGVVIDFDTTKSELTLKQAGGTYLFAKEK